MIAVLICLASGEVVDSGTLDIHSVWSFGVVGETSCPLDCSRGIARVTACPDAHTESHGGLRIVGTSIGSSVRQGADHLTVNQPLQLVGSPKYRVIMEVLLHIGGNRVIEGAVVGSFISLPEVVRLGMSGVSAHELPINLVEIVRLKHNG